MVHSQSKDAKTCWNNLCSSIGFCGPTIQIYNPKFHILSLGLPLVSPLLKFLAAPQCGGSWRAVLTSYRGVRIAVAGPTSTWNCAWSTAVPVARLRRESKQRHARLRESFQQLRLWCLPWSLERVKSDIFRKDLWMFFFTSPRVSRYIQVKYCPVISHSRNSDSDSGLVPVSWAQVEGRLLQSWQQRFLTPAGSEPMLSSKEILRDIDSAPEAALDVLHL